MDGKVLNLKTINPNLIKAQYAVRGELAIRAEQLKEELKSTTHQFPFSEVTNINIGNPQQLGQKPITFFRQVSSLLEYPDLLREKHRKVTETIYPIDAIERAHILLKNIGAVGAYSVSQGIPYIRQSVANFISERDGYPADPNLIFLTSGASVGVQYILNTIISDSNTGIMIPIPQYPLYSATLTLFNGKAVPYYLNEDDDWSLDIDELISSLAKAKEDGVTVRALVIINPGNPTGNCLSLENMKKIISFCKREKLVLLADEVYQTNIYFPDQRPFHSFKKVLKSMGDEVDQVELISFHSISKGMIGECGRRGGYFECTGILPEVISQLYKLTSIGLCPNVQGQIMVELMVNPPKPGQPSFDLYKKEIDDIFAALRRRSIMLHETFNQLEGFTCSNAQGALYLFPKITLPPKAVAAAEAAGKKADTFYCLALLNATGVCAVPGSGFGQKDGTWHFRATFLPPEEKFEVFLNLIRSFHKKFMETYS